MDDPTPLTRWLADNAKELGARICEYGWRRRTKLPAFDFQAVFSVNGRECVGRGVDAIEEIALEKAIAEALETAACWQYGIASDGVAAHTNSYFARRNAKSELIERRLIDHHRIHGLEFRPLVEVAERYSHALTASNSVEFFSTLKHENQSAVLCLLDDGYFQYLGSALWTEADSTDHAFFEAYCNFIAHAEDPEKFRRARERCDSLRKSCGRDLLSPSRDSAQETSSAFAPFSIWFEELSLEVETPLRTCPARVWRAHAEATA